MKRIIKILVFFLCAYVMALHPLCVSASSNSVIVKLIAPVTNTPIVGMPLNLYQVAIHSGGEYQFTEDFLDCGIDFNTATDESLMKSAEKLSLYINDVERQFDAHTVYSDEYGNAFISDLPAGIYFASDSEYRQGDYDYAISAFLISVSVGIENPTEIHPKISVSIASDLSTSVTEPSEPSLPQTGMLQWPVSFLAGIGILCFGIGVLLKLTRMER